jgi:hypothetical protein
MCCISAGWATCIVLLGRTFLLLLQPHRCRAAFLAPPEWLAEPRRGWLRMLLLVVTGLCFLVLSVPFALAVIPAAWTMPELSLMAFGLGILFCGMWLAVESESPDDFRSVDWLLPVRGKWVPYFMLALGVACALGGIAMLGVFHP